MAKNTGHGHRIGLVRGRYQKKNPISGLFDKYDQAGNYRGTKKTGGPWKGIIRLFGRNPHRS